MHSRLTAGVCAFALTFASTGTALAHDCFIAKKPPGAGSAYSEDVVTGEVTPLKNNPGTPDNPHGSFQQFTAGGQPIASSFVRAPEGVLPPAREGGSQYDCDGKGLDAFSTCP